MIVRRLDQQQSKQLKPKENHKISHTHKILSHSLVGWCFSYSLVQQVDHKTNSESSSLEMFGTSKSCQKNKLRIIRCPPSQGRHRCWVKSQQRQWSKMLTAQVRFSRWNGVKETAWTQRSWISVILDSNSENFRGWSQQSRPVYIRPLVPEHQVNPHPQNATVRLVHEVHDVFKSENENYLQ